MRVLVTGHRGKIGQAVVELLQRCGHTVTGFDLADGADLLDLAAVKRAAAGCAAIVHLGALAHDTAGSAERIMAVNVLGTWHVLLAAEAAGAERVVHFSSAQALGITEGERLPDYFPVDDDHPRRAMRPYGLSKRLAEDLCAGFTARTAIPTVSLRPVAVWGPDAYARVEERRRAEPASEWEPFWEYGAFVDIRDVAAAAERALSVPLSGHHRALLCAADIAASAPSLELAGRLAAPVPIRNLECYAADPWRALVDCSAAEAVLGWQPRYRWSGQERATPDQRTAGSRGERDETTELVTERLRLRPFQAADLEAFAAYRSDPEVARYQSWNVPYSLADAERFLASQRGAVFGSPGQWLQLAAIDRRTGALYGDCAARVLTDQPNTAEVGVTLARASQGKGIAAEALGGLVTALFERGGMHRVYAQTDDRNSAAQRLVEGLGFRCEARLVEADWFKGEWTTVRTYAVLSGEWRRR